MKWKEGVVFFNISYSYNEIDYPFITIKISDEIIQVMNRFIEILYLNLIIFKL